MARACRWTEPIDKPRSLIPDRQGSMADGILTNPPQITTRLAATEALRNQLHMLEKSIADLIQIMKSMPKGEIRNRLLDEIGALDVVLDVMRNALGLIREKGW
jgi:hypothetical protein